MNVLRNKRRLAGLSAIAAALAATFLVVLPALASNQGDLVPQASGQNVTPTDVGYGGSGQCSNLFPNLWKMGTVYEYDNPNPQTAKGLTSGSQRRRNLLDLSLGGTNKQQTLGVTAHGAAILALGIKGGNDTTAYDYRGLDYPADGGAGWVTADTGLHAPASKFTVTGNTETNITQYYGVSLLNVCYRPLVTVSGTAFKDLGGDGSISPGDTGIGGLAVTLKDTSTGQTLPTQLTAANSGSYSFSVPAGDGYQVCVSSPTTFGNAETAPTASTTSPVTSASCSSIGQAAWGYAGSNSQSNLNFGFAPLGTIQGLVYEDNSSPTDGSYDSGIDTPESGWTLTLYDNGAVSRSTTSDANGNYSFSLPFNTTHTYTVCETRAGSWGQSEPTSNSVCGSAVHAGAVDELAEGYPLTPSSTSQSYTSKDFGNVDGGMTCTPNAPFGMNNYQTQLANCDSPKQHNQFMFESGTLSGGGPFVSVWSSGPDTMPSPMVEKITFNDPLDNNGQPSFTGIKYDDTFPFTGPYTPMPYCTSDPRTAGSEFSLGPNPNSVLPSSATSCLISTSISATTSSAATLVAYVYSDIDGLRTSG